MRTDEWFYELFRRYPRLVFDLMGQPYHGQWRMESITVKTTEKRMDGVLFRQDRDDLIAFLEVQGYPDDAIYWRVNRDVATWYETSGPSTQPFLAVVLFLDARFDPGPVELQPCGRSKLVVLYLKDCLKDLASLSPELVVLRPLVVQDLEAAKLEAPIWSEKLATLKSTPGDAIFLMELLTKVLLGRFETLSQKEVTTMLGLTPLHETRAGRELIADAKKEGKIEGKMEGKKEGKVEGLKEGLREGTRKGLREGKREGRKEGKAEGIVIGQLQLLRQMLGMPELTEKEWRGMTPAGLKAQVTQLQKQLPPFQPVGASK